MNITIAPSWKAVLQDELTQDYFKNLMHFIADAYQNKTCYPPQDQIFAAFNTTAFEDVKVVILGQDPYHGEGQANGLCFSVAQATNHPPSLKNIFKEVNDDVQSDIPKSGNLDRWAKQGILLLNATLTVEAGIAGSHQGIGWEKFTDAIIAKISEKREGVIFLLWGGFAKKKKKLIDTAKHTVLESGHPSPLSANRGYWFGNKHFSKTNEILRLQQKTPIAW